MADPFDPEGEGYDEESARAAGLGPDETGHWPSRVPDTGLILKGRRHPTYNLTEQGETEAGYQIHRGMEGRYYSIQAPKDGEPPILDGEADLPERVERQALGFLNGLLNRDTPPKTDDPMPTMAQYPSDEHAEFARANGFGYGSIVEPYVNQQTAKIYGEVTAASSGGKNNLPVFTARSAAGARITDILNAVNDQTRNINVDLTALENRGIRDRLGLTYAKAALAVEANAIAKLGFDPNRIMLDVQIGQGGGQRTVNLGGLDGPQQDAIYANLVGPGALVHESIHRGIQMLRQKPELVEAFSNLPQEELIVRYMMVKYAGDVEASTGEAGLEQRKAAIHAFEKSLMAPTWIKNVNLLMRAAEQEIARKHPGGPR